MGFNSAFSGLRINSPTFLVNLNVIGLPVSSLTFWRWNPADCSVRCYTRVWNLVSPLERITWTVGLRTEWQGQYNTDNNIEFQTVSEFVAYRYCSVPLL
jgi:hypothetical protein